MTTDASKRPYAKGGSTCTIEGCDKRMKARGLCNGHYGRKYRGANIHAPLMNRIQYAECQANDCARPVHGQGYCTTHYWRFRNNMPLNDPIREWGPQLSHCRIQECERTVEADNLCNTHYRRKSQGEENWERPIKKKAPDGQGHLNDQGYRMVRHNGRMMGKHLVEFEKVLGRPVRTQAPYKENVHHKNGNRDDNRTDGPPFMTADGKLLSGNLELWSKAQPGGQEIGPKMDWATEMIVSYGALMDEERWKALECAYLTAKTDREEKGN